jgi:hypothetical protein
MRGQVMTSCARRRGASTAGCWSTSRYVLRSGGSRPGPRPGLGAAVRRLAYDEAGPPGAVVRPVDRKCAKRRFGWRSGSGRGGPARSQPGGALGGAPPPGRPGLAPRERRYLTRAELLSLLDELPVKWRTLVELLAATGLVSRARRPAIRPGQPAPPRAPPRGRAGWHKRCRVPHSAPHLRLDADRIRSISVSSPALDGRPLARVHARHLRPPD